MSFKNIKNIPNNIVTKRGYSGLNFPLKLGTFVPKIINQPFPLSRSINPGLSTVLNVEVAGFEPLFYQWYKGSLGVPVTGATTASLVLTGLSSTNEGNYFVVINNAFGTVRSLDVSIAVNRPAAITSTLQNLTAYYLNSSIHDQVTFNVSTSGTLPITYSWYKNSSLIGGANTSSYTTNYNLSDNGAIYLISVQNFSTPVTASAILTVLDTPLSITNQPISNTLNPGFSSVTFTVAATGRLPISYQWRKNGTLIEAATSQNLTITNIQETDEAQYDVLVSNLSGLSNDVVTLTSNSASLSVNDPVGILVNLSPNLYFALNATTTLSAQVSGTQPISFQWYKDDQEISGATLSTYSLTANSEEDLGAFYYTASNIVNAVTSNVGVLILAEPAGIVFPSGSLSLTANPNSWFTSLNVYATGTEIAYQWNKDSTIISGATASYYTLSSVAETDEGVYRVVVSNAWYPSVTSEPFTLSVNDPVGITQSLSSVYTPVNTPITLSAQVSGTQPISYQWYKDNTLSNGETLSTFTLNFTAEEIVAVYYTATNIVNTASSNTVQVSGLNYPAITSPLVNVTLTANPSMTVTLSVEASGSALQYQWNKNNSIITGASSSIFVIDNAQEQDQASYQVVVSNVLQSVTSVNFDVSINDPAGITRLLPSSLSALIGDTITLSATLTGTIPFDYQWYKNNSILVGETLSAYIIDSATPSNSGAYFYTASNIVNAVTSNTLQLSVFGYPEILSPLVSVSLTANPTTTVTLTVEASGTTLGYQWTKNNTNILTATAPIYTIENIQETDQAIYNVIVTNNLSSVTSVNYDISVNDPVGIVENLPSGLSASVGSSITLSAVVSGTQPVNYQWYKDGSILFGSNLSAYTIATITESNSGSYFYTATNIVNSVTSNTSQLTIVGVPVILSPTSTVSLTANPSTSVTLSVLASGFGINYQWKKNDLDILTATSSAYTISSTQESDQATYKAVVYTSLTSLTSAPYELYINDPVTFTWPITGNETFLPDTEVILYSPLTGTLPITYQWYKNNSQIFGATLSSYTISSITPQENGDQYQLVASNIVNTVSSSVITLSVYQPVNITQQPVSIQQDFYATTNEATFTVQVTGQTPYVYNWYKNGVSVYTGGSSYTVDLNREISATDFGTYFVTVSNIVQQVTSNNVLLSGTVSYILWDFNTPAPSTTLSALVIQLSTGNTQLIVWGDNTYSTDVTSGSSVAHTY